MRLDDRELVSLAKRGDEAAFHEIVERYGSTLYRLAVSLLGNAADAEDALQETFSGAFRAIKKFEGRSSLKTWLTRILVNQVSRGHRTRARFKAVRLDDAPVSSGDSAEASGRRMDVLAALESLPPEHREVIALREMQGMSYEEIAEVLGVPRGTVESRLFRARRALRDRLRDYLT